MDIARYALASAPGMASLIYQQLMTCANSDEKNESRVSRLVSEQKHYRSDSDYTDDDYNRLLALCHQN
jgi:hypothetical protein